MSMIAYDFYLLVDRLSPLVFRLWQIHLSDTALCTAMSDNRARACLCWIKIIRYFRKLVIDKNIIIKMALH